MAAEVPVGMAVREQLLEAVVAVKAQQAQTAHLMLVVRAERVLLVA
jgi:hypothetical protein